MLYEVIMVFICLFLVLCVSTKCDVYEAGTLTFLLLLQLWGSNELTKNTESLSVEGINREHIVGNLTNQIDGKTAAYKMREGDWGEVLTRRPKAWLIPVAKEDICINWTKAIKIAFLSNNYLVCWKSCKVTEAGLNLWSFFLSLPSHSLQFILNKLFRMFLLQHKSDWNLPTLTILQWSQSLGEKARVPTMVSGSCWSNSDCDFTSSSHSFSLCHTDTFPLHFSSALTAPQLGTPSSRMSTWLHLYRPQTSPDRKSVV